MASVAIIDYGVGNLRSVEKAFRAGGVEAVVSADEDVLRAAERLVLPGVGAFRACMEALGERGFDLLVRERVAEGTPLLGVCVGMQMLFEESEEFGTTRGLGLLRGRNTHHILEGTFKAAARALRQAVERDPRVSGVPSTKGVL